MNDRELLELAAKAAGYVVLDDYDGKSMSIHDPDQGESYSEWNPLTDDGDALRLAVRLSLKVDVDNGDVTITWITHIRTQAYLKTEVTDDPMAATRRAIVRATAEIGKTL